MVIDHKEGHDLGIASGHGDVEHWFPRHGKTMDDFRRDVEKELKGGEDDMTQEQFDAMMEDYLRRLSEQEPEGWSAEAREWAEDNGIIRGDEHGNKQYRSFCTREQMVVFLKRVKEM